MVATPPAFSRPRPQLMVWPLTLQVPAPAGDVRVNVTGPVSSAPAGRVSVRSVCRLLPGPRFSATTVQLKGWLMATAVRPPAFLLTRKSTRWRVVVGSLAASLVGLLSGSLALTVATLRNTSPSGAGWSMASKRRKMDLDWLAARSPRARPVVALPAGAAQVKVGSATPAAEVWSLTEHSGGLLQVLPPKVVVSQTKRTRLPAGGVITSLTRTPVPYDGPVLLTRTW
ncbi:MAG: hypothetical protein QE285_12660 [Aquabacterium sp.]|nr:hypothetical protein [Aquabacterium sp.]